MRRIVSSGSNSDVSSEDDSSDVSDLDKFEEACADFGALTAGVDPRTLERDCSGHTNEEVPGLDLPGGVEALHSLANVPKSWPLAVDYPTKCSQQAPGKVTLTRNCTLSDFFLCCRIALDSCGQIVARSQKEIKNQLTYGKQQETTQPTQTNQGKGELK